VIRRPLTETFPERQKSEACRARVHGREARRIPSMGSTMQAGPLVEPTLLAWGKNAIAEPGTLPRWDGV
jgi:hypothetical protein